MKRILVVVMLLANTAAHAGNYELTWDDVQKPWRHNWEIDAAVQADAAACDREVGEQRGLPNARYKRCMGARHWKLNHVRPIPAYVGPSEDSTVPQDTSSPSASPSPVDASPPPEPQQAPPAPDIHPFCPNPIC
jgi:hypothetical protein